MVAATTSYPAPENMCGTSGVFRGAVSIFEVGEIMQVVGWWGVDPDLVGGWWGVEVGLPPTNISTSNASKKFWWGVGGGFGGCFSIYENSEKEINSTKQQGLYRSFVFFFNSSYTAPTFTPHHPPPKNKEKV